MQLLLSNEYVADRIILDFLNRVDDAQKNAENILLAAKTDYIDNPYWNPYNQQLIYSPTRVDSSVLSLFGIDSSYTGGTHGIPRAVSVNYDLATGDVLTLASIMHVDANKEEFIQLVLQDLQNHYEEYYLFDDFEEVVRNRLGGDDTQYQDFYFTGNGLAFYFSPYEIAPYASGVITVEIPYSQLNGLLYAGYFPDEQDTGTGTMHINHFNDMDLTQFTCMEEVLLTANEELIVLYPDELITDVQIILSGKEDGNLNYTVFASPQMLEKTAVILGIPSKDPPEITVRYSSNGQECEITI